MSFTSSKILSLTYSLEALLLLLSSSLLCKDDKDDVYEIDLGIVVELFEPFFTRLTVEFDGKKADVWSLGVCLFVLRFGYFPFDEEDKTYTVDLSIVDDMILLDLLEKMLSVDPALRPSIGEVMNHPWLKCEQLVAEQSMETGKSRSHSFSVNPLSFLVQKIFSSLKNTI